jgi:hypothetical protein
VIDISGIRIYGFFGENFVKNIDKFAMYLVQCVDAHIHYLQGMTSFISSDSEQERIREWVLLLKGELNRKLDIYISQLRENPADYKALSVKFKKDCSEVIQNYHGMFQESVDFSYDTAPSIRGFLGIFSAVPFFPFLVVDTSINQERRHTFYNNPRRIYDSFFDNFSRNFMKIRPLDCLYPITYDSDIEPLMNITPEEWHYAKQTLKPNGIIAENGTKLRRKDPENRLKIEHSFIVIDGIIYAQGNNKEYPSTDYMKSVRYSKDEFGAIWVLKKMAILPYCEARVDNEVTQTQDLGFSYGSVTRSVSLEGHRDDLKAYLPCVFVRGQGLSEYIKKNELKIPDGIDLMISILQEIDMFHKGNRTASGNSLKHGDLHAGNIIIGDNGEVKLIDFGQTSSNPSERAVENDIIDFRKRVLCPVLISLNKDDQEWVNKVRVLNGGNHHSADDLIASLIELKANSPQADSIKGRDLGI